MAKIKLTDNQRAELENMAANGEIFVGSYVPVIERTYNSLVSKGLAKRTKTSYSGCHYEITDAGRAAIGATPAPVVEPVADIPDVGKVETHHESREAMPVYQSNDLDQELADSEIARESERDYSNDYDVEAAPLKRSNWYTRPFDSDPDELVAPVTRLDPNAPRVHEDACPQCGKFYLRVREGGNKGVCQDCQQSAAVVIGAKPATVEVPEKFKPVYKLSPETSRKPLYELCVVCGGDGKGYRGSKCPACGGNLYAPVGLTLGQVNKTLNDLAAANERIGALESERDRYLSALREIRAILQDAPITDPSNGHQERDAQSWIDRAYTVAHLALGGESD